MENKLKPFPWGNVKPQVLKNYDNNKFFVTACEFNVVARTADFRTKKLAIMAWNSRIADKGQKNLDFEKIAQEFTSGQVEGFVKEQGYSRECALLYLWFFNHVPVSRNDLLQDNGRAMYRKFAEAVADLLRNADDA